MKSNKLIIGAMTIMAVLNSGNSFAQSNSQKNSMTIGGISISGGGLQLIGTITTSTNDDEKNPNFKYLGWTLIVVGSLVEGGDVKAAPINSATSNEVLQAMGRDCRVSANMPELGQGTPMESSAESIDYLANQNQKISKLCGLVSRVQAKAPTTHKFSRELALEISGQKDLSARDLHTIQNIFALYGII